MTLIEESEALASEIENKARELGITVISFGMTVFRTAYFEIGAAESCRQFIFTTIAIGAMPKPEGSPAPGVATREMAVNGFLEEAADWLQRKRREVGIGATLAWRALPEVTEQEDGKWQVRARIAVA